MHMFLLAKGGSFFLHDCFSNSIGGSWILWALSIEEKGSQDTSRCEWNSETRKVSSEFLI